MMMEIGLPRLHRPRPSCPVGMSGGHGACGQLRLWWTCTCTCTCGGETSTRQSMRRAHMRTWCMQKSREHMTSRPVKPRGQAGGGQAET